MGVEAAETIFVDDFARNIEAANRLGMRGILFTSREQAMAEIEAALSGK
ncbi:MAG: HAD-IA family hydrolase [Anaerolineae bacterium]|nr:HAD-IA family hydrolase [Anaerolineae bacterium]